MVKTTCTICKKEIDCPQNMLDARFHICSDCFQDDGALSLLDKDPKEVHLDLPMEETEEIMAEQIAGLLTEGAFEEVWEESKEDITDMGKKELCKHMFAVGAYMATIFEMQAVKNPPKTQGKEKEEN